MTNHERIKLAAGYAADAASMARMPWSVAERDDAPYLALRRLANAVTDASGGALDALDAVANTIGAAEPHLRSIPAPAAERAARAIHHADAYLARVRSNRPDPAADAADAATCAQHAAADAHRLNKHAAAEAYDALTEALTVAEDAAYGDADAATARDALAAAIRHVLAGHDDPHGTFAYANAEARHAYTVARIAHDTYRREANG